MPKPKLKLKPTRAPSQARSRDTVRRILDAALSVLRRNGVEGFTSNHVAREAGLSVASLYQFFPNKHAIVYRLYQDWLEEVTARLKAEAEAARDERDWRRFAERLAGTLSSEALDAQTEYELLRAMWSHRDLIELDRRHTAALGETVADYLERFGAPRPRPELAQIAGFANELYTLVAERTVGPAAGSGNVLGECARVAYLALWRHALRLDEPLTARPAAGGRTRAAATSSAVPAAGRRRPGTASRTA